MEDHRLSRMNKKKNQQRNNKGVANLRLFADATRIFDSACNWISSLYEYFIND